MTVRFLITRQMWRNPFKLKMDSRRVALFADELTWAIQLIRGPLVVVVYSKN
ncbi:hypothetical protein HCU67_14315 [Muricauda sp. DJ-13]|uniref:Uncharacterized protein n=1 Tax=Croceivirga thetidis TaxID=2721623 RepID=A0ABX1GT41_9FLAO|nr:hypothetical protein [Croceivirga thetidis]